MWVIKLGGSWINNPELKKLIKLLTPKCEHINGLVVGGGIFADSIRDAQKLLNFDDHLAHNLAIKSTEFYAKILKNICENIQLIKNPDKLVKSEKLQIWIPYNYLKKKNFIEKNWNSTSDTIALWLAKRVKADGLILIKSMEIKEKKINMKYLENKNIIDENIKKHVRDNLKVKIVGPEIINILQSKQSWTNIISNLCDIEFKV